jgi:type II secretory ATPase GspE/PulE/Tfp pilus assembly ATPase PilB-like protein
MVNQNGMNEENQDADDSSEVQDQQPSLTFDFNQKFETMDWWPNLADLDRLNILNSPKEDRARLLASKYSKPVEEIMLEIGKKTDLEYQEDFEMPENPTKLLPMRLIHNYCCLPIVIDENGKLCLVTPWPPSEIMSRWIFAVSGMKPIWSLGSPEKISRAITENFGIGADSLDESDLEEEGDDESQDDLEDQNAAIIRFVNEVIQRAIVDRATDIHFEPHKDTLQIRYRIDGQLVPVRVPDNLRSFQDAIISRIKIMSGINISEKRRPQGGRITFSQGQSDLDIRVSTLPTLYGESISLRLLNEKSQPLSMRELGLLGEDEINIVSVLEKPHGIVLVTGPTGSGKSTSLTAFIRRIHKPERRIMTVEDPVEYEVAGINQTQVNSEIGFTFASALREILRQDPDVIMVGEIRDRETADIAIRASLTGHLVLSTLHTNDAPGAITRLIDMEIEPFLIASSVEMVIAQRLVRRLCKECAKPTIKTEREIVASLALLETIESEIIHRDKVLQAVGCPQCQNLGYRGRVGIFELMRMSDPIHSLVIKSASAPDIREVALKEGMSTLQGSGWNQIKRGLTTIEEVIRYADGFVGEENTEEILSEGL